ncbi:MAG: PA14 domain-containing protein [Chitinophagaceae bacterium]|nr:PA14 domain-containing protein [Chitinophagaceae bacterium]
MNPFVRNLVVGCFSLLMVGIAMSTRAQSVFDPGDQIVVYNPANPPAEPSFGNVGKWVKTNRLTSWNTSSFKAYIYKGVPFRLKWPKNYDPSGNTKYPLFIFFHGKGEWGSKYDNEYQLYHGGELHKNAVDNGKYNGFLLYPQVTKSEGLWYNEERQFIMELVENFLIPQVYVDPFRISVDGLSGGGLSSWRFFESYPKLVAACLPISNASSSYNSLIVNNKFTPVWLFQGALDQNPKKETSQYLNGVAANAGANFTYTEYPDLGHGCWYSAWNEPDYFPYLNRANKANPWPLDGRTEFCYTGPNSIYTIIGVTPGFNKYEWRRNDTLLTGVGTFSNTLTVTDTGTYSCRILKGTIWSEWSPIPVKIKYKTITVPPAVKVSGLASKVLPAPDGKTTVNLEVPADYANYKWEKTGDTTTLSWNSVVSGVGVGSYRVKVTEKFGCSSTFSNPFTVISANGPNKPDPATNLIAIPLSYTSMKLNWSSNPGSPYPQTHFEIYQATQSGGPYQFISLIDGNVYSFVKEGLTPGIKYYYVVRAVNNTAAAPVSNEASATTQKDIQPPTAPGNLQVIGSTRNYISLAWDESTDDIGLAHYEIYINGVKSYVTSETEYTVYGLNYGSSYNFTVKAVDIAGNKSAPSNQVTAQPLNKGLTFKHYIGTWDNLPDFNTLTPISTGVVPNVTLSNASQAENYAFLWEGYIRIPSEGNYVFGTTSDDGSKLYLAPYSYTASALINNDGLHGSQTVNNSLNPIHLSAGIYPIAITFFQKGGGADMSISWRKTGSGGWSTAPIPDSAFVDPPSPPAGAVPAKPSNLTATAVSFKRINLTWTDNSNNEKSFELYRSTDPLGNFVTIGLLPANTTTFADTLVAPATTYYYKVRAINQYGESDFDKAGPGVDYAYYEKTGMEVVPDFNTMTPLKTGRVNTFGLGMQMRQDNFALKFEGYINIITEGDYIFYLNSDDGSRLYIDDNLVVNYDGLHGAAGDVAALVPIHLSAGPHSIRVTFFEATGNEVLIVKYEGPGVTKKEIPANVLGDVLANATTMAAPPAPAAPGSLTAVGISNSAIKVAWTNHAIDANNIELYRSYNGNEDYVLLAVLPASTTSYNDVDLYPSSLFYYKVRAAGEGGKSGYSNEDHARTLGVVPSVVPIENVYMRYDTQLQLKVEATSGSPVAIDLQANNLPSFATFNQTENGKGVIIFDPSVSDAGVYNNIVITAANPQGDMNTTQFSLTVNDNYLPHINQIPNATVAEKASLQINLSATDQDAGDQLVWSYSGLPGFATVSSSNRTATLTFNPQYGNEGEYRIKAHVNDGHNGKDTASFILKVTHTDVANPNDGTVPVNPQNLTGIFVNSLNGVKLTWTNMAYNALRNEIYRSNYMTGGYVLLNPGANNKDDTSYVDLTVTGNKIFYYMVRAVNANGGSNSLIVKTTTPNRAPVVSAQDIYVKSGNVVDINVTATDDPGDVITLKASNLPSFATFTDNGNGNGIIHLAPTGSHIGTYNGITLTASDNYGSTSSKTIKLIVTDKYITSVFVNFNNKNYPISFMPWNSFDAAQVGGTQVKENTKISNLKDETGEVTTMSVQLLESWPQHYTGLVTGNNSGIYPDSIMMSGYYFYVQDLVPQKTIRIAGLNGSKKYNLIFFGNRGAYSPPQTTYFTAGGQTVSLNATDNTSSVVQINSIASTGGIIDVVIKGDTKKYAVINAMVIQEYDNTIILPPYNLNMVKSTKNSISLSWKSNTAGLTTFEIWRSDTPNGTYIKLADNISGNVFTDTGLPSGTVYYYKVRAVSDNNYSDYSDYVHAATILYSINLNFNDAASTAQSAPWNNTNALLTDGYTLPNLLNEYNQYTGISMTVLENFSGFNDSWGLSTGNNSGAVPDIVMQRQYYVNFVETARIRISGLNQSSKYNFVFFASSTDFGRGMVTEYVINNKSVQLDAKNNTSNTVQLNDIEPDATGSVEISLYGTIAGGFGLLSNLTIQAVPSIESGNYSNRLQSGLNIRSNQLNNTAALNNGNATVGIDEKAKVESSSILATAYPNPFVDDVVLKLYLNNKANKLAVLLKDISGRSIYSTEFKGVPAGESEHILRLKGRYLSPGIYWLQVADPFNGESTTIKILK